MSLTLFFHMLIHEGQNPHVINRNGYKSNNIALDTAVAVGCAFVTHPLFHMHK